MGELSITASQANTDSFSLSIHKLAAKYLGRDVEQLSLKEYIALDKDYKSVAQSTSTISRQVNRDLDNLYQLGSSFESKLKEKHIVPYKGSLFSKIGAFFSQLKKGGLQMALTSTYVKYNTVNAFEKPLHPFSLNTYILQDINRAKNDCNKHALLDTETVLLSKEEGAVYAYQFTEKGEERVLYDTLKKRFEDEPNESKKLENMIQKSYGRLEAINKKLMIADLITKLLFIQTREDFDEEISKLNLEITKKSIDGSSLPAKFDQFYREKDEVYHVSVSYNKEKNIFTSERNRITPHTETGEFFIGDTKYTNASEIVEKFPNTSCDEFREKLSKAQEFKDALTGNQLFFPRINLSEKYDDLFNNAHQIPRNSDGSLAKTSDAILFQQLMGPPPAPWVFSTDKNGKIGVSERLSYGANNFCEIKCTPNGYRLGNRSVDFKSMEDLQIYCNEKAGHGIHS
ncbi:MAG: hypothetical protein QRY74_00835 [Chlamydia sp.]